MITKNTKINKHVVEDLTYQLGINTAVIHLRNFEIL